MIGSRLGPYEITAKLGEGGMGEVYRATDGKLKREVAVKVLPAAFTEDEARLARFEREAQLLAQLHHPHIASVFGLEESSGVRALVMELVEGPTLADRLLRGALPLAEALEIARQIAEALEAAHEKGIVHRDLKPQNIKAPVDGPVKVLDFGLAKALDPVGAASGDGSAARLEASPTLTLGATVQGVILGTAAYMAPEQAKGGAVDRRVDIWAFGVLLYEMLTGERLFEGDSAAETLAGVLKTEIDLESLPEETPEAVRRLLRRCLERHPRNRLHDIADARLELEDARSGDPASTVEAQVAGRRSAPAWWAAGALAAGLVAVLVWLVLRPGPVGGSLSLSVSPLTQGAGLEVQPTISPDGKLVAYASDATGNWDIYVVRATGGTAIDLTAGSPEDDLQPAFSPDGELIAFRSERAGGGIFVMGATGESVRRLTDTGYNPSWSPDGRKIAFSSESVTQYPSSRWIEAALWVVDTGTGETVRLLDELDVVQPSWSPHGHRIAFWGLPLSTGQRDLWTVAADGGAAVRVTADGDLDWSPTWSPDGRFLYFSSDRGGSLNLWRVAIDERSGEVLSAPEAVTTPSRWSGQAALAADGATLVYTALDRRVNAERVALDPQGAEVVGGPEAVTRGTVEYAYVAPSPDGTRLGLNTTGRREDLYVLDLEDHELRRLTDDPGKDRGVAWSPDGRHLSVYSDREGKYEIWWIRPDGSGLEPLTRSDSYVNAPVWSPDGLALTASSLGRSLLFDLAGELPSATWTELPALGGDAFFTPSSWSGDGRRIAGIGISPAKGTVQPGVVLYDPETGDYRRIGDLVSMWGEFNGAPVWLPDDRHLVLATEADLMLVDTETGEQRRLLAAPSGSRLLQPHPTSDGRTLYYLRLEEESDLWIARLREER
ncbi:MAG: protein kinase [Thermoanaerobaculia bacterium]